MNYTTAVMLINTNIRAIKCTYEPDTDRITQSRTLFKTLDKSIAIGDYVVVPTDTRHKMTVVKVVEVDTDVDFEDPTQVGWIIGKVSIADYTQITTEEERAIKQIKDAEKLKKRNELRDSLLASQAEVLKALPIATMGDAPAIDAPTDDKAA